MTRERVEFDFEVRRSRLGMGAGSVAEAEVHRDAARRSPQLLDRIVRYQSGG